MRVLHTADWHLGHSLAGFSRAYEHGRFLDWLGDRVEETRPDALVIAGDIFDHQNPAAEAQAAFYRFLAGIGRRRPGLTVVVVAGNHDGAQRLQAPAEILRALDVHVVGHVRRDADGRLSADQLLVPVRRGAEVLGLCAAVPFLRPADLLSVGTAGEDPWLASMRAVYDQAHDLARARLAADCPGVPVLATGHLYAAGCLPSANSERRVFVGGQEHVPAEVLLGRFDYVALGHLHRAQAVGGQEGVRYAGSPLPLATDEAGYRHQVVLADLAAGQPPRLTVLPVPRAVAVVRLPGSGAAEPLDAVLDRLRGLDAFDGPAEQQPFLAVKVRIDRPEPLLRQRIDQALEGRNHRLVVLQTEQAAADGDMGAGGAVPAALTQLRAEQVFRRLYADRYAGQDPDPALLAAFHQLEEAARHEAEEGAADGAPSSPDGAADGQPDATTDRAAARPADLLSGVGA